MNSFPFKILKHIKIKKKKKSNMKMYYFTLLYNKMLKQLSNIKILILTSDL